MLCRLFKVWVGIYVVKCVLKYDFYVGGLVCD